MNASTNNVSCRSLTLLIQEHCHRTNLNICILWLNSNTTTLKNIIVYFERTPNSWKQKHTNKNHFCCCFDKLLLSTFFFSA